MNKIAWFPISLLTVVMIPMSALAQGDRLKDHFGEIIAVNPRNNEIYQRLIATEPQLAKTASDPRSEPEVVYDELKKTLGKLQALQQERGRKRQRGRAGLPKDHTDRLACILLVATMPDLNVAELKVPNGGGGEAPFNSVFFNFVRGDIGGIDVAAKSPGTIRDIATQWVVRDSVSFGGNRILQWGLENGLKEGSLLAARELLATPADSPIFINPLNPRFNIYVRESHLRVAVNVIEKWGDGTDLPALVSLSD